MIVVLVTTPTYYYCTVGTAVKSTTLAVILIALTMYFTIYNVVLAYLLLLLDTTQLANVY
jgi:hypothetical protein